MLTQSTPSDNDITNHLRDDLIRLNWLQYRRFGQEIAELHLTVPQFYTLSALQGAGGKTSMGALARQAQQVSATMTGIIDRLTRAELVQRQRFAEDRRSVLVELTPSGEALVQSAWDGALEALDSTAQAFTPAELQVVRRFVCALAAALER
ncbi:MAG: winged helix DNA-binding protein [Caldilineales bacterium]|nr:winged helix DNA-binding protein [Caldilineales bacterium]